MRIPVLLACSPLVRALQASDAGAGSLHHRADRMKRPATEGQLISSGPSASQYNRRHAYYRTRASPGQAARSGSHPGQERCFTPFYG